MDQISSKLVEQLIYSSDHPAHLKDNSGKYLVSNDVNNSLFITNGISSIVGHTIWDLNTHMEPLWGSMAVDIEAIESHLQHNKYIAKTNIRF